MASPDSTPPPAPTDNSSSPPSPKPAIKLQMEHMLRNAITMTEMSMDMKERLVQGEKYVCYLRTVAMRGGRNMRNLQATCNQFLAMAHRIVTQGIVTIDQTAASIDYNLHGTKIEYEKLLSVIEHELSESADDPESSESEAAGGGATANNLDRIKYLEAKQKLVDNAAYVHQTCSVKSMKSDVDEKYPENWSRDSLIDLNSVVNLPPVPEDIFTCFTNKQPTRTSSLSSLKGVRKVKLFLQRAANNSDDEDSSDLEDSHDMIGDNEATEKSKKLCNITEETPQD